MDEQFYGDAINSLASATAPSTRRNSETARGRFKDFCRVRAYHLLPAQPFHVAMFLQSELSRAVLEKLSYNVIDCQCSHFQYASDGRDLSQPY